MSSREIKDRDAEWCAALKPLVDEWSRLGSVAEGGVYGILHRKHAEALDAVVSLFQKEIP